MSGSKVKATRRDIRRTIGRSSEAVLEVQHQRLSKLEEQATTQAKASKAMIQHIDTLRDRVDMADDAFAVLDGEFRGLKLEVSEYSKLVNSSLYRRLVWLLTGKVS